MTQLVRPYDDTHERTGAHRVVKLHDRTRGTEQAVLDEQTSRPWCHEHTLAVRQPASAVRVATVSVSANAAATHAIPTATMIERTRPLTATSAR